MKVQFFRNYPELVFDVMQDQITAPAERWSNGPQITIDKMSFLRFSNQRCN